MLKRMLKCGLGSLRHDGNHCHLHGDDPHLRIEELIHPSVELIPPLDDALNPLFDEGQLLLQFDVVKHHHLGGGLDLLLGDVHLPLLLEGTGHLRGFLLEEVVAVRSASAPQCLQEGDHHLQGESEVLQEGHLLLAVVADHLFVGLLDLVPDQYLLAGVEHHL